VLPHSLHPSPTRRSSDLDGLVFEERAIADGGRGRRTHGPTGHDGSAKSGAADGARIAVRANGPVVDEAAVTDGEGPQVEDAAARSEEHTSELQSPDQLVC